MGGKRNFNSPVDFVNEVHRGLPRRAAAKGTSQSFVSITDTRLSSTMLKIRKANAQYFEDRAPWLPRYRKQESTPPIRQVAVETAAETGDFRVNTVGDNLPNEDEIREKIGSKNFFLMSNVRALN